MISVGLFFCVFLFGFPFLGGLEWEGGKECWAAEVFAVLLKEQYNTFPAGILL